MARQPDPPRTRTLLWPVCGAVGLVVAALIALGPGRPSTVLPPDSHSVTVVSADPSEPDHDRARTDETSTPVAVHRMTPGETRRLWQHGYDLGFWPADVIMNTRVWYEQCSMGTFDMVAALNRSAKAGPSRALPTPEMRSDTIASWDGVEDQWWFKLCDATIGPEFGVADAR